MAGANAYTSLMDTIQPGDRVGVFHYKHSPTKELPERYVPYLIGYGFYNEREEVIVEDTPESDSIFSGEEWTELFKELGGSPKLVLDSGEVLFGWQVFWALEDDVKKMNLNNEEETV